MMRNMGNRRLKVNRSRRKLSTKVGPRETFTITRKTISDDSIKLSGTIGSKIIIGLPDDTPIFNMNAGGAMPRVFLR